MLSPWSEEKGTHTMLTAVDRPMNAAALATLATRATSAPAAAPPKPRASADTVTLSSGPTTAPVRLSGIAKGVQALGNGLARVGLFGGLAIGAGIGLGAGLALGTVGMALPLLGGALIGFEAADAHAAGQALSQGTSSPAFLERQNKNRSLTPATAGAHIATVAGGLAAFGAGLGLVGGVGGMLAGVGGTLALAGLFLHAGGRAEKAALQG